MKQLALLNHRVDYDSTYSYLLIIYNPYGTYVI